METNINTAAKDEVKPVETNKTAPANAPTVYFSQEEKMLEQQLKMLKRIHRWGMIRTLACIAMAVIVLVCAIKILPPALLLLSQLGVVAQDLAAVDFQGLTEQINQLAIAGTEGLNVASEAMTATMEEIGKLNFESLGKSVESLGEVVDNLKSVTDVMGRLFR